MKIKPVSKISKLKKDRKEYEHARKAYEKDSYLKSRISFPEYMKFINELEENNKEEL